MPRKRIPPSERTSQRIGELLSEGVPAGEGREGEALASAFVRLGVRRVIEELLEAEVSDVLGREYYRHADRSAETDPTTRGYRNGYRPGRLKTAEGEVDYAAPQVSDRDTPFHSRLRALLRGRTDELERLATEMYARGLSTRDIEDATRDEEGRALLSRTAVSQVTETLWEEYEAFATRDLSEFDIAYLFLDGLAERLHPGQRKEAVLCAWGLDVEGKKHLLHLTPGTKEDTESVRGVIQDMKRRGLRDPLLVTTDGAGGLIAAVEEAFPRSVRQRCLAHKQRNLEKKVHEDRWPEFKAHATACYQAPSVGLARALKEDVVERYDKEVPAAVQCFLEDFEACIAHLRFPLGHRAAIRTTNLLERLFGEERRRTKVLPHAFGERPLLKLMFAATLRASERWRGLKVTNFERGQLAAIREELNAEFKKRHKPATRSARSRISSKTGT
jgi:transposase-like protein